MFLIAVSTMTSHHNRVRKHLEVLKEEGIENQAARDRSRFGTFLVIAGGVILVFLMLSFVIVSYPIGTIIAGQLQSTLIQGNTLVVGNLSLHFLGDTATQLEQLYIGNADVEFSACLVGSVDGADYLITSLYVPTMFSQSFAHVTSEPCAADAIVMLHSHPYKSCRASETDLVTLEKAQERNPDIIMAVLCEPKRASVYR